MLLTPFERNLEVWRQLWRVIERSDLVVQIVDARNPLLFRTEDLERYVHEVDPQKRNLLLVNKADLMTLEQRQKWADWFEEQGIRFAFYSARLAKEAQETSRGDEEEVESEISEERAEELAQEIDDLSIDEASDTSEEPTHAEATGKQEPSTSNTDPRTQILTVFELQSLFLREAPPPKGWSPTCPPSHLTSRPRSHTPAKNNSRPSRLPQRRQIFHHKLSPRRKTRVRLLHPRQNQTLPNDPSAHD